MFAYILSGVMTIASLLLLAPFVKADVPTLNEIVAAWNNRKSEIKRIRCWTKSQSFYPAGSLSEKTLLEQRLQQKEGKNTQPFPAKDKLFSNELCAWALDFARERVRKEYTLTEPYFLPQSKCILDEIYGLHLFIDGKYRVFCPKQRYPKAVRDSGSLTQDVTLYEGASHSFLFSFVDLPLLWIGGAINGHWPLPTEMQYLDKVARFIHHGPVQWKGRNCVLLTLPEQKSKTTRRELWVDCQSPYAIYYCRARSGNRVNWELQVEYRKQEGFLLPIKWSAIDHNHPGKLFTKRTFHIEKIEVNGRMPRALFEKKLEPGMVAFHVIHNKAYDVDDDGNLVPLGTGGSNTLPWIWIIFAVTVLLGLFALTWRFMKRRKETANA